MYLRANEDNPGAGIERVMMKFGSRLFFGYESGYCDRLDTIDEYYDLAGEYGKTGENKTDFLRFIPNEGDCSPSTLTSDLVGFMEAGPSWRNKYISVVDMINGTETEIKNGFAKVSGPKGGTKVMKELFTPKGFQDAMSTTDDIFFDLFLFGYGDLMDRNERFERIRDKTLVELHRLGLSDKYRQDL